MNRWLVIRVAVTALVFLIGLQGGTFSPNPSAPTNIAWRLFAIVFGIALIGGFCSIGAAYQNKGMSSGWTKPSWYASPFQPTQNLQKAHFFAVAATTEGIGEMLRGFVKLHYEQIPPPGLALAFGLGMWIALYLAIKFFHGESN